MSALRHTLITAALMLAACGARAGASSPLPAELPAFGKDKPMPAPEVHRHRLPNGLQVWVVPRQGLPRVDAVLTVREAGATADGPQQAGFAALLAGLLTEGSQQRDARAIAQAAQALGGALGANSGNDGITLSGNALPSKAGPLLALLAEVARQPAFADGEVNLAKANALQALKAASARPGFRADGAMGKAIYGDHPYGNTQPDAAAIEAVTPTALRNAHAQRFRPERSLLVIAGRIDAAQALTLARANFGDWKAQGEAPPAAAAAPAAVKPVRLLLDRPGSVQATLRLARPGVPANHPDYVPLKVATGVLGDGFSSRINMNLREEKGYTYGASTRSRNFAYGGAIVGGADVRNEVTGASLKEYDSEYRRMASELVGAEELKMTQRYIAGSFLVGNQVQAALAGTLSQQWLVGLPPEFLAEYVPRIYRVDAEQVRTVAKKYLVPEEQSIVVVGDKAALAEQLKPYGEFTTRNP